MFRDRGVVHLRVQIQGEDDGLSCVARLAMALLRISERKRRVGEIKNDGRVHNLMHYYLPKPISIR